LSSSTIRFTFVQVKTSKLMSLLQPKLYPKTHNPQPTPFRHLDNNEPTALQVYGLTSLGVNLCAFPQTSTRRLMRTSYKWEVAALLAVLNR
jgi:hypothetical protein